MVVPRFRLAILASTTIVGRSCLITKASGSTRTGMILFFSSSRHVPQFQPDGPQLPNIGGSFPNRPGKGYRSPTTRGWLFRSCKHVQATFKDGRLRLRQGRYTDNNQRFILIRVFHSLFNPMVPFILTRAFTKGTVGIITLGTSPAEPAMAQTTISFGLPFHRQKPGQQ